MDLFMVCPGCHQAAKESQTYPGTYVCRCLGYLEDVSKIARQNLTQSINAISPQQTLLIQSVQTVDELITLTKEVNRGLVDYLKGNAGDAGLRAFMSRQLTDSKWFQIKKDSNILYAAQINSLKLMKHEGYFYIPHPVVYKSEQVRKDFKEITERLIKQGSLDPKIFERTCFNKTCTSCKYHHLTKV
jgi:hypothetical protein